MAPTPPPPRWLCFALFALALLAWSGALINPGFAFDDAEGVLANPQVNATRSLMSAFAVDYWHHLGDAGHYRPLTVLSLAFDFRVLGASAFAFHFSSILAHAAVVLFAALFVRRAAPPSVAYAWLLGLALFAVHPALADAVAWISGRSSPLSLLPGVFFAWLLIVKREPTAAFAFACIFLAALLGALAKEDGWLAAAFPVWIAVRRNQRALAAAAFATAIVAYFALRFWALDQLLPAAPHAPLAGLPLTERLAAGGAAMAQAVKATLLPDDLAPAWRAAPWPRSLLAPAALIGWSVWLACAALAIRNRRAPLGLCLGLAALAWIPLQQWIPAGEIFAPRFLYQTLFFLSLPAGLCARKLLGPSRANAGLAVLIICALPMAWQQAQTYSNLGAYESATIRRFPRDPRAWNGRALAYELEQDLEAAVRAYEQAIELDATYGRPHSNLARLALANGQITMAAEHFEIAAQLGPGNPIAWTNLGSFQSSQSNLGEAKLAYQHAVRLAPGLINAWRGLARTELALGDLDPATSAIQRALALNPNDPISLQLEALINADI